LPSDPSCHSQVWAAQAFLFPDGEGPHLVAQLMESTSCCHVVSGAQMDSRNHLIKQLVGDDYLRYPKSKTLSDKG